MEISVHKRFLCLFRQIYVAPYIGILKAHLTDLAILCFLPVFPEQHNFRIHLGTSDRTCAVGFVDPEEAHGETALGAGVDVDQFQPLDVYIVGRFAAHKQHAEEGCFFISQHAHIGGRKEGDRYFFRDKKPGQGSRVFNGLVRGNVVFGPEHIECSQDHNNGCNKIQGREHGETVFLREQGFAVFTDRGNGPVQISILMENALGISCRSGGIDRKSRVMGVRLNMTGERLQTHYLLPVCRVELILTSAVLTDKADPVRRIDVLDQGPRCAGFPDPDHGNDRKDTAGEIDQDEILLADSLLFQPCVDPARHLIQLMIGDSFCISLIKKDRGKGIPPGILLKSVKYCG